jgi:hypothetical protein
LIELDPKFVDVIVKRWEEYTGKKAVREAGDSEPEQELQAREHEALDQPQS